MKYVRCDYSIEEINKDENFKKILDNVDFDLSDICDFEGQYKSLNRPIKFMVRSIIKCAISGIKIWSILKDKVTNNERDVYILDIRNRRVVDTIDKIYYNCKSYLKDYIKNLDSTKTYNKIGVLYCMNHIAGIEKDLKERFYEDNK